MCFFFANQRGREHAKGEGKHHAVDLPQRALTRPQHLPTRDVACTQNYTGRLILYIYMYIYIYKIIYISDHGDARERHHDDDGVQKQQSVEGIDFGCLDDLF